MNDDVLSKKKIILGVTGGVAVYKAADICSALVKRGADVQVVMTEHAKWFVGPGTFRALTNNQVITDLFEEPEHIDIRHVALAECADVMLIAPATANIIGKIASGIADDMLSTTVMAMTECPVILAPAMNCRMWGNPIVRENVRKLKSLGYRFVGPEQGRLACGEVGVGRLSSAQEIIAEVVRCVELEQDFKGVSILVTAGPTQEPIDPVRFIGNRSSGKMGYAIAQAARDRGANVILVSGPTSLDAPAGVELASVKTAAEMLNAVTAHLPDVQVVIGAAAVADYTPKSPSARKIKKNAAEMAVELVPTVDIIGEVGKRKDDKVLVTFAAETDNVIENAQKKLRSKNADLIVANDVSRSDIGFGTDENQVTIIGSDGAAIELPKLSKAETAGRILDAIKGILEDRS